MIINSTNRKCFGTLLDLQKVLIADCYNKLELQNFSKLRNEVDLIIEAIILQDREKRNNLKQVKR